MKPNFINFSKEAPIITGIDIKKVNSVAFSRVIPSIKAVIIVIPDLDVPGKIAAITWDKPIIKADLYVIWAIIFLLLFFSIIINNNPTIIKAIATEILL